ncbi:MAG: hypothetical protein V1857_01970 [archaeon]
MSGSLQEVKSTIESLLNDPIAATLLRNSSLTPTQFETFLIRVFGNDILDKPLSSKERTSLRMQGNKISRGSFNRTFIQARRNIVRSLYVVFLLGYVGLFDTPELQPFIETASRIRAYANERVSPPASQDNPDLKTVMDQLTRTIEQLARFREDV